MSDKSANVFDLIASIVTSKEIIIAVIGGIIGTFLSPWTKWLFDKKKIQIDNRKEKIRQWREEINKHSTFVAFSQTSTFQELKNRLTKEELSNLYNIWLDMNPGISGEKLKLARFHDIVSQIEKEWQII